MKPPSRDRRRKQSLIVPAKVLYRNWTLDEKKRLVEALKCHPATNIAKLQEFVTTRSLIQIEEKLKHCRKVQFGMRIERTCGKPGGLPDLDHLEVWRTRAEQLMQGSVDYSMVLGQVMSAFGTLELRRIMKTKHYSALSAIYRYIAALIKGDELPVLKPKYAAILLELVEGLTQQPMPEPSDSQHRVLLQKQSILCNSTSIEQMRRRLSKDPLAVCNGGDGPSGDGPSGAGPSHQGSSGDGPSGDGPSGAGPSRQGSSGDGPSGAGPSRQGPSGDGPSRQGSSGDGPSRQGPSGDGPSHQGPSRQGPSGAGPSGDGPSRHGPARDCRSRAGPTDDGGDTDPPVKAKQPESDADYESESERDSESESERAGESEIEVLRGLHRLTQPADSSLLRSALFSINPFGIPLKYLDQE